jgi:hypothetical protein
MNTTTLLEKLIEIEWALQRNNNAAARALVMQAEDCVLQMDRDMIRVQTEKVHRAAYSPSYSTAPIAATAVVVASPEAPRWRSILAVFSRMLVTALRTSLQRLPSPI